MWPNYKKNILVVSAGLIIAWFITDRLEKMTILSASAQPMIAKAASPVQGAEYPKTGGSTTSLDNLAGPKGAARAHLPAAVKSAIRPMGNTKDEKQRPLNKAVPSLILSGVLLAKDGNFAIINDRVVKAGDEIKGAKVSEITLDHVVLAFEKKEITLHVKSNR